MYNVLMVDDDPMILEDNKTYFSAKGYAVVCADTAETAEKIILSNALDCVILDVDLPGMSLWHLLRIDSPSFRVRQLIRLSI